MTKFKLYVCLLWGSFVFACIYLISYRSLTSSTLEKQIPFVERHPYSLVGGSFQVGAAASLLCVTTYNPNNTRSFRHNFERFVESYLESTDTSINLLIVDDCSCTKYREFLSSFARKHHIRVTLILRHVRGGIARSKNTCIRHFLDSPLRYQHLFLADHDVQFIKNGWSHAYIEAAKESSIQHFSLFLDNKPTYVKQYRRTHISFTPFLNGAFLYFGREALLVIGGMKIFPHFWGHEHTEITRRAIIAGYAPAFVDIPNSGSFIILTGIQSTFSSTEKVLMYQENEVWMKQQFDNLTTCFAEIIL